MLTLFAAHPFFDAYAQSDFFGKCIFLALTALSFASWIIIIKKIWLTKTLRRLAQGFQEKLSQKGAHPLSNSQDLVHTQQPSHPFLRLFSLIKKKTWQILEKNQALSPSKSPCYLSTHDVDFVQLQADSLISSEMKTLGKHLHLLFTIVTLAPFLGLLGTVWGILITFSEMQAHAGNTSQVVLGGLSMALATTVYGLLVAIPALIAYNYLRQSLQDFETEMENFSDRMLATVEIQYRKVDTQ